MKRKAILELIAQREMVNRETEVNLKRNQVMRKLFKMLNSSIWMYINPPPHPNEPSPEDPGEPDVQEILGNLDKPKELFGNASLSKVTLEDCQTPSSLETDAQRDAAKPVEQSQAWADSTEDEIEEFSKAGSEKPQEAKLKEIRHEVLLH